MNYVLGFRPQVVDDVAQAFHWYEGRGEGLGLEFLRAYYGALGVLSRSAEIHRLCYKGFRRILLRRFPYAIYFQVLDKDVTVVMLAHCARNPKLIKRSLRERSH